MNTTTTDGLVTDIAGLLANPQRNMGHTEWAEMTQEQVNAFAELTGDHNFIHVDPERAKTTPFGGTIAHGLYTLSLLAPVTQRLKITDAAASINYGSDRIRFPAPLRVGDEWRGAAEVVEATEIPGGAQARIKGTIEVKGSDKPAVVAEFIVRFLGAR